MLVGKKQNIYSYLAHRYALFLWVLDVEIYRECFFIGPALKVLLESKVWNWFHPIEKND